jgi:APA family basic amino acid/polyamine antiporter
MTSVLLVFQLGSLGFSWRWRVTDCCHNISPAFTHAFAPRTFTTIWTGVIVGGVAMLTDIGSLSDLTNIGTLFAFILVCLGVIVLRRKNPLGLDPFGCRWYRSSPFLG